MWNFQTHIANVVDEIKKVCDPKIYVCELLNPKGKIQVFQRFDIREIRGSKIEDQQETM